MERQVEDALTSSIGLTSRTRAALRRVAGLVVIDEGELGQACDPLKLTLWLPRPGVDGVELDEPEFCEETTHMLVALLVPPTLRRGDEFGLLRSWVRSVPSSFARTRLGFRCSRQVSA